MAPSFEVDIVYKHVTQFTSKTRQKIQKTVISNSPYGDEYDKKVF
jgi:hypothetical protein